MAVLNKKTLPTLTLFFMMGNADAEPLLHIINTTPHPTEVAFTFSGSSPKSNYCFAYEISRIINIPAFQEHNRGTRICGSSYHYKISVENQIVCQGDADLTWEPKRHKRYTTLYGGNNYIVLKNTPEDRYACDTFYRS